MRRHAAILVLGVSVLALVGCCTMVSRTIEDNCPLGTPQKDPDFEFAPTAFVIRDGYVLEHNAVDKIPPTICSDGRQDLSMLSPGERGTLLLAFFTS